MASDETTRLRVLISNDDGISAPGLLGLVEQLLRVAGSASLDLRVCAPAREQSAKSHSVSLLDVVRVSRYVLPAPMQDVEAAVVEGTPVDCVKFIILSDWFGAWKPELVVSGINAGKNTGLNIHYSGTCAVAREANINGIPSVALSLAFPGRSGTWQWGSACEQAAQVVAAYAQFVAQLAADERQRYAGFFVNCNFPSLDASKGWKWCRQGRVRFQDYYVDVSDSHPVVAAAAHDGAAASPPSRAYRLRGKLFDPDADDLDTDNAAVDAGYASISLIPLIYSVLGPGDEQFASVQRFFAQHKLTTP